VTYRYWLGRGWEETEPGRSPWLLVAIRAT